MAIEVTPKAAEEIKSILTKQNQDVEKVYLRVAVKGGGCSGFQYAMDMTDSKGEFDEESVSHGIRIISDPKSLLFLEGTTIDFKDELMGRSFVFNNPNASRSCGCGSSFSV
jgi:iron-sulfur cluster assembly protein